MANEEQLAILRQGVEVWNKWRLQYSDAVIDLRETNLEGINLDGVDLSGAHLTHSRLAGATFRAAKLKGAYFDATNLENADLSKANLTWADLQGSVLSGANLSGANLTETYLGTAILNKACLDEAYLNGSDLQTADLEEASLRKAQLIEVDLRNANLRQANLTESILKAADLSNACLAQANLRRASLYMARLNGADLTEADLSEASLINTSFLRTKIYDAVISRSKVYGVNIWDLEGEFKDQKDLVITREGDSPITVDNIKVAQFVYLILNNKEIRDVIDTVTTTAVLILGRFYDERKQVLDALKEALREHGFVPILFDFEPSKQRDLTETVQLLANMAKFVIADITDAKSIPQELSHIIPSLPSVPVQPILLASEREYAMFEHWRSYRTVLPEFFYRDTQDLLDNLELKILQPIDTWRKDQTEASVLQNRIKELEAKLSDSK